MRIKPSPATPLVREPHTLRHLHADGEDKPETAFWLRRLRDGDVVLVEDAAPEPSEPAPAAEKPE